MDFHGDHALVQTAGTRPLLLLFGPRNKASISNDDKLSGNWCRSTVEPADIKVISRSRNLFEISTIVNSPN